MFTPQPAHYRESQPHTTPETPETEDATRSGAILTAERGYYEHDGFFIKRSLLPSEFKTNIKGQLHVLRLGKERIRNEVDTLRLIRRVSNIPVPRLYGAFEVDES